jgi:hypothetical protein
VNLAHTGVTEICDGAFRNCLSMEKVQLPASLISIGERAFNTCGFEALDLSNCLSLVTVGKGAFRECRWVKAITFPASLRELGAAAMEDCVQPTSCVI